jgi:Icc-related predicted phosphoesterase
MEVPPKLHVFGHIHEGYGVEAGWGTMPTLFVNASYCDRDYRPVQIPRVVVVSDGAHEDCAQQVPA